MTQRISDEVLREPWEFSFEVTDFTEELLSLRAAVRRVNALHWAFEKDECRRSWLELVEGLNALRAEMGGIDKEGGV